MVLKYILGHETIQTTQKHVHLSPEDLQRQHWKYSPVEDNSWDSSFWLFVIEVIKKERLIFCTMNKKGVSHALQ